MNGRPAPVPISRYYEEPGISAVKTESHRGDFMWSHAFNDRWVLRHRFREKGATYRIFQALFKNK